jgi:CubicO group peptidase (beta-lactamase class C family)
MRKWNIPGGAVAVSVEGRLVFARGHARADRKKGETVQPDSLFRIASLSKPITAAAILKLVEESQLRLDDKLRHLSQQPLLERVTAALPEFFAELSVLLNCGASYIHRVRNPSHQR